MLLAKVNPEKSPAKVITAFTGREFVSYEWRPVPAGYEDEAKNHPYLVLNDVVPAGDGDPGPAKIPSPAAPVDDTPTTKIHKVDPDQPADQDLEGLTVKELQEIAQLAEVDGWRTMRKAELIEALQDLQAGE